MNDFSNVTKDFMLESDHVAFADVCSSVLVPPPPSKRYLFSFTNCMLYQFCVLFVVIQSNNL